MYLINLGPAIKKRIMKFNRYLDESDSKNIMKHGYDNFAPLREEIHNMFRLEKKPNKSGLNYKTADKFANDLGNDLENIAMDHIISKCGAGNFKLFDLKEAAEIQSLANDIKDFAF